MNLKFIPKWDSPPVNMTEFIKSMKAKWFSNPQKEVIYRLHKEGKIVYTKNRLNEEYFSQKRYRINIYIYIQIF